MWAVGSEIRIYDQNPEWLHQKADLPLIATVLCGDVNFRDADGWQEVTIESRHKTATDFEHDSSKVFFMRLVNPNLERLIAGRSEFTATAVEGYWYDADADPTKQSEHGYDYGEVEACDGVHCDEHPFAPFMPPQRSGFPRLVRFVVSPSTES